MASLLAMVGEANTFATITGSLSRFVVGSLANVTFESVSWTGGTLSVRLAHLQC